MHVFVVFVVCSLLTVGVRGQGCQKFTIPNQWDLTFQGDSGFLKNLAGNREDAWGKVDMSSYPWTGVIRHPDVDELGRDYKFWFYPDEGAIYWDGDKGETSNVWSYLRSIECSAEDEICNQYILVEEWEATFRGSAVYMKNLLGHREDAWGKVDMSSRPWTGVIRHPDVGELGRDYKFWFYPDEGAIYWDDDKGKNSNSWRGVTPVKECPVQACPKCSNFNSDIYERTGMEYHVADAKVEQLRPTAVGHKTITNRGSRDQTLGMSISETVSETMSFSHTAGIEVSVGTEFKCGVPLVASGKVSVEVSASYEFSYGTETSVEKEINAEFSCTGPPGKKTICEAVLIKDTITVPYTMTWALKWDNTCTCKEEGEFKEIAANRLELEINEYDLSTNRRLKRSKREISAKISGGFENYLI